MLMPLKASDYGIRVEYSKENGFRAYQLWSTAPLSAENDVWEAYLGVPLSPRELEVFRSRLAQFSRDGRENFEITNFLSKALLETWDDSLATCEDRSHQDYPSDWKAYVYDCCSDLEAWIRDREYDFVWEDWEDCWYTVGSLSGWCTRP